MVAFSTYFDTDLDCENTPKRDYNKKRASYASKRSKSHAHMNLFSSGWMQRIQLQDLLLTLQCVRSKERVKTKRQHCTTNSNVVQARPT